MAEEFFVASKGRMVGPLRASKVIEWARHQVTAGACSSWSAGDKLKSLLAAMNSWCIPVESLSRVGMTLTKALARMKPSPPVQHREHVPMSKLRKTVDALGGRPKLQACLLIGFWAMMRAGELLHLEWADITFTRRDGVWVVTGRHGDKTHHHQDKQ